MKLAAFALFLASASTLAHADDRIAIDPNSSLMGFAHCQSVAGDDSYKTKIYLHEDFLQGDSYGMMTGELLGLPAFNHFAHFITTKPGLDGESFTLTISAQGKELGTLKIKDQGLVGTLSLEDVKLECQPLNVPFKA